LLPVNPILSPHLLALLIVVQECWAAFSVHHSIDAIEHRLGTSILIEEGDCRPLEIVKGLVWHAAGFDASQRVIVFEIPLFDVDV
jgi:hypothetical protein